MRWLDAASAPLGVNLAIFAACAAVVWFAGTRLAGYSEMISERTHAGQAFIGTVLLGAVSSLPEGTMAITAAALGNPQLAVNILLGGVALVVAILAITDAVVGAEPLSSDIQRPVVLLEGSLLVLLLSIAAAGMTAGDIILPGTGIGAWTTAVLVIYGLFLVLVKRNQERMSWITPEKPPRPPNRGPERGGGRGVREAEPDNERAEPAEADRRPLGLIILYIALADGAVLIAGWLLARTADRLAAQTGLGASFVGFVLGGLVTSLPELSSTVAAARLQQEEMVFGDAFGTNLYSLMLLFVVDAVYWGGPVLNGLGRFSLFAALLGIAVTSTYLAGLIGRPKLTLLRMGIDSVLVLCLAAVGLSLLYRLR